MIPSLSPEQLEAIRRFDTCTLANAIETFELRLRNEGYCDPTVRCLFPRFSPMLGYAATVKIRCAGPPSDGPSYLERTDWWNYILSLPPPRVIVIEDVDRHPGGGGFVGEVHCHILLALDCVGAVTNGGVRDLPAIQAAGFHLFAGNVSVSHSYAHIVEIGVPVEVGRLKIQSGDLLHGDCHGVLSIPLAIAAELPAVAARIVEKERELIALCRSSDFSLEKLRHAVKGGAT